MGGANAVVLGISFDGQRENAAFAEKFGFPFKLLCDTDRKVGLAYGACDSADDGYPRRMTFVISPEGKIEEAIDTQDPGGHAEALATKYGSA